MFYSNADSVVIVIAELTQYFVFSMTKVNIELSFLFGIERIYSVFFVSLLYIETFVREVNNKEVENTTNYTQTLRLQLVFVLLGQNCQSK